MEERLLCWGRDVSSKIISECSVGSEVGSWWVLVMGNEIGVDRVLEESVISRL